MSLARATRTRPMSAEANTSSAPIAAAGERAAGLPLLDKLTLFAIGVVVLLVSITRVRSLALRENELDAMRLLRTLAAQPAPPGADAHRDTLAASVARDVAFHRRIDDLELLPDGRLRRHGYLFDRASLAPGEPMLRAWPWKHGESGLGAFVWTPQRGCLGFANEEGGFSGPERPPQATDVDRRWLRMPRR